MALQHVGDNGVRERVDASEVSSVDAVELIDGQLPDGAVDASDSCVVHENVDPSPRVQSLLRGALGGLGLGNVADDQLRRRAPCADLTRRRLGKGDVVVDDGDPSALGPEPLRDAVADACGAARDYRDLIVEPSHVPPAEST